MRPRITCKLRVSSIYGDNYTLTYDYTVQLGIGDLTRLNIAAGDEGGELDPHGADGNGNPIGGLVFSSVFGGQLTQMHEWTVCTIFFLFRTFAYTPSELHVFDRVLLPRVQRRSAGPGALPAYLRRHGMPLEHAQQLRTGHVCTV